MNTTSKQSTNRIVSEADIVSEATSDREVRPSEENSLTFLPHSLKPQKKISKKKKKFKRRRRLREVVHFDSDEEEELYFDWGNFFHAWKYRDD